MLYVLYGNFGQYAGGRNAHCKAIILDDYVVVIEKAILFCLGFHV
jgi:hypothetical protein